MGIENVIDDLCDAITVWYVMPEILRRPVIVNLWGMTGVGKTDLVRKLVDALDLLDRFVEVELSDGDGTSYHSSVASVIARTGALDGKPTMILFDEIQRFNTLDSDGKPLTTTKFADFWELLSDGRLARRDRSDFERSIADMTYAVRDIQRRQARGEAVREEPIGPWQAQNFITTFGLSNDVESMSENANLSGATSIDMSYDAPGRALVATIGGNVLRTPFDGRVDKIGQDALADTVANVCGSRIRTCSRIRGVAPSRTSATALVAHAYAAALESASD